MVPCKHKPIQPSLTVLSERAQRFYPYIQVCKHCGKQIVPKHPRWIRPIKGLLRFWETVFAWFCGYFICAIHPRSGPSPKYVQTAHYEFLLPAVLCFLATAALLLIQYNIGRMMTWKLCPDLTPVPKAEFDPVEQAETAHRQQEEEAKNYNENIPLR